MKNFVPLSCKTGRNLEKLREIVINLAQSMQCTKEVYPASFYQLEGLIIDERRVNTPPVVSTEQHNNTNNNTATKRNTYRYEGLKKSLTK